MSSSLQPQHVEMDPPAQDPCPPCELLFSKLQSGGRDGKLIQHVKVQERGEPKSGTGFMYFWATATFIRTCRYLQGLYGKGMLDIFVDVSNLFYSDGQVRCGNYRLGVIIECLNLYRPLHSEL